MQPASNTSSDLHTRQLTTIRRATERAFPPTLWRQPQPDSIHWPLPLTSSTDPGSRGGTAAGCSLHLHGRGCNVDIPQGTTPIALSLALGDGNVSVASPGASRMARPLAASPLPALLQQSRRPGSRPLVDPPQLLSPFQARASPASSARPDSRSSASRGRESSALD